MSIFRFVFDAFVLFVRSQYFELWFYLFFALLIVALVPRIIRELFLWR